MATLLQVGKDHFTFLAAEVSLRGEQQQCAAVRRNRTGRQEIELFQLDVLTGNFRGHVVFQREFAMPCERIGHRKRIAGDIVDGAGQRGFTIELRRGLACGVILHIVDQNNVIVTHIFCA